METNSAYSGWTVVIGTIGFILIVVFLHMVQPNYNSLEQQMSELALGRFGSLMILACSSFAFSVFALQIGLQKYQPPIVLRLFLIITSFCLLGAGLFRLDTATNVHTALLCSFSWQLLAHAGRYRA